MTNSAGLGQDRWSAKGAIFNLDSADINDMDQMGFTVSLRGNGTIQDSINVTSSDCTVRRRGGSNLFCKIKNVGSVTLKPDTRQNATINGNKVRGSRKGSNTERVSYYKVSLNFQKRDFAWNEILTPLEIRIVPLSFGRSSVPILTSVNSVCKETIWYSMQWITCTPDL